MVRAGVVKHPSEWAWCGDDELTGRRSRYRILATERMLESLGAISMAAFQRIYTGGIQEFLQKRCLTRDPAWTESLAVGEQVFVEKVAANTGNRFRFKYTYTGSSTPDAACCVCEKGNSYNSKNS